MGVSFALVCMMLRAPAQKNRSRVESAGVHHEVTQDVRVSGLSLHKCHFQPELLQQTLPSTHTSVFPFTCCFRSFQLLSCPFRTVGSRHFLQLMMNSQALASGSWQLVCRARMVSFALLHDQRNSVVMRCSETSIVAVVHRNVPSDIAHTPWTVLTFATSVTQSCSYRCGLWFASHGLRTSAFVGCTPRQPRCAFSLTICFVSADTQSLLPNASRYSKCVCVCDPD